MNLTITEGAQKQFETIVGQRDEAPEPIRIFAQAGGGCACSGPSFGMGFDQAGEGDTVIEVGSLTFLVDAQSAPILEDASIDYVDDVMQSGFAINAPNAAALGGGSCGCGGH